MRETTMGSVEDELGRHDGGRRRVGYDRPAFTPGPASTLAVAALLAIAAALVALQARLFVLGGLPPALVRAGALGGSR